MEKISLLFLGTGSSIPTKKRNHTSILLSYKNENILIDCGEGTQRQFKYADLSPTKLTRVLITHWHGDHTLGLLGLLQTLAMSDYSKTLEIYGPKGTKNYFSLLENFLSSYKRINMKIHEVSSGKIFETPEFEITASQMSHGIPSLAYSFQIKDKLRLDKAKIKKLGLPNSPLLKKLQEGKSISFNGKKISSKSVSYEEKGRKISFILDTTMNENAVKIAKNSDILISESSFSSTEEKTAEEHNHLTSKQAAKIAKLSKSKSLILTHLSQKYEHSPEILLNEAKKIFKNTSLAYDLQKIEI